ncbi:MAG TPA: DUF1772 domain-containing protein [Acidobacteriaceae bacterium]|jgi:uncharacterized membrane protein|nr:DUF1772 domain-containing protein [Acidobacteriaceae bacterium]
MTYLLDIATTVCIGLLIGTEFAVSAFINPIVWKLDERAQSQAVALFARKLGTVMPFWYGMSLLLLLVETAIRRHQAGVMLLGVAVGIWAAVIVLTLVFLVPINNRMTRLDGASFAEASRREHRKWDGMHRVRVAALIAAMVCFLLAVHA